MHCLVLLLVPGDGLDGKAEEREDSHSVLRALLSSAALVVQHSTRHTHLQLCLAAERSWCSLILIGLK